MKTDITPCRLLPLLLLVAGPATAIDTDGDGLEDDWELNGIPIPNSALRYPLANANPNRKDIFVEIDAMTGQAPGAAAVAQLVQAFASAPVPNPDGSTGITLHLVLDETALPVAPWTYAPSSGIGWPPEFGTTKAASFGTVAERTDPRWNWSTVYAVKLKAYRYGVLADRLGTTTVSGLGEVPGNDFLVTFGAWPAGTVTDNHRVAAIMHELGHNLGLLHGGPIAMGPPCVPNFKPNYHSVMNYTWTYPRYLLGWSPAPTLSQQAYAQSWRLDYSRAAWPTLNEAALFEPGSICGGCGAPNAADVLPVGPPGPWGWGVLASQSQPVDWNRDGDVVDPSVAADANWVTGWCPPPNGDINWFGCPSYEQLQGADDWSNLAYALSGSSNFASGAHGLIAPTDEPSFDTVRWLSFVGGCAFEETFDGYPVDEPLHGPGFWRGWDGDPAYAAAIAPGGGADGGDALLVDGAADVVHRLCADDAARWLLTVHQYVPGDFVAGTDGLDGSWLIVLNRYDETLPHEPSDWSIQIGADSATGMLSVFHGAALDTIDVPYAIDRWVRVSALVDLESDWTRIYYDDELVTEYPWTGGVLGGGGGAPDIAAVDLYANGSSPILYDDLRLRPVASACGDDPDLDLDGDGLTLLEEIALGTDACNPDSDLDGHSDGDDLCPLVFDPEQIDADGDGIGDACDPEVAPPCPADFDGSGDVGFGDLLQLLGSWGACAPDACPFDLDGDGVVGFDDLLALLAGWGPC